MNKSSVQSPAAQSPAAQSPAAQIRQPLTPAEARERAELNSWLAVCNNVSDPTMARLIVEHFEASPQLLQQHPGLYLAARKAVKTDQIRYARAQQRAAATANAVQSVVTAATSLAAALRTGVVMLISAVRSAFGKPIKQAAGSTNAAAAVSATTTASTVVAGEAMNFPAFDVPHEAAPAVVATMSFPPIVDPWLH